MSNIILPKRSLYYRPSDAAYAGQLSDEFEDEKLNIEAAFVDSEASLGSGLAAGESVILSRVYPNTDLEDGGYEPIEDYNDSDSQVEVASALWGANRRYGMGIVEYQGYLWLLGGLDNTGTTESSDVWRSSDGTNWTLVTNVPGWAGRGCFVHGVLDNKIVIAGGRTYAGAFYRDVWTMSWTPPAPPVWAKVADPASWTTASKSAFCVFDNALWRIGSEGADAKEVWKTDSGPNLGSVWTQMADFPTSRQGAVAWASGGYMYAGLGFISTTVTAFDVWRTADGSSWGSVTTTVPYGLAVDSSYPVLYDGHLLCCGGVFLGALADFGYLRPGFSHGGFGWNRNNPWGVHPLPAAMLFNGRVWMFGTAFRNGVPVNTGDIWSMEPVKRPARDLQGFYMYRKSS